MKTKVRIYFLLSILPCLLMAGSCTKTFRSRQELVAYVNSPKNGLVVTDKLGQVEADMTYKPWQLMLPDHRGNRNKTDTSGKRELSNKYFFVLSLSANHKELLRQLKFSDYSEMVQVLAFRMADYVSAVPDHGKAVEPVECLFQQTYGMASANQLLIVFDKSRFDDARQIKIKIREFGLNTGNLDYRFSMDDIRTTQDLVFTN